MVCLLHLSPPKLCVHFSFPCTFHILCSSNSLLHDHLNNVRCGVQIIERYIMQSPPSPNIFLNTFLPSAPSLCSSLNVRDQVLHLFEITYFVLFSSYEVHFTPFKIHSAVHSKNSWNAGQYITENLVIWRGVHVTHYSENSSAVGGWYVTSMKYWQVLSPTYFPLYFVWWWEYFLWC